MKKIIWLGILFTTAAVLYLFAHNVDTSVTAQEVKSSEVQNNSSGVRRAEATPGSEQELPQSARTQLLTELIADQISLTGAGSPEVADLVSVSQGACTAYVEKAKKGVMVVGWANDYLASACKGFDASKYKGIKDPAPDFQSISIERGQDAVAEAALNYLKRPDSTLGALKAGMVLKESGKVPLQSSLGLSDEQFARALAAANASTMCPGQDGCVVARLLAAATCAESSCPVGTTYESAMRRNLSPVELEASIEMIEWLNSMKK